jgi:class 3 adenylate cyclase
MAETRKLAAILAADVVGYSRLAGSDEERTLSRLRGLRSDLVDPAIAAHRGRVVKRTGDGILIEFRSVVDAVRCAIEVQNGMVERNAGLPSERRIEFRVGIHLGDVVEESDGDLMGDGVNIAARLEGIAKPGAICLSEDAYRQVKSRLDLAVSDLGPTELKNIAEPVRVYSLEVGRPVQAKAPVPKKRWTLAPLATAALIVLCLLIVGGGGAAFFYLKYVQGPKLKSAAETAVPPVEKRTTAVPVDQQYVGRPIEQQTTTAPIEQQTTAAPVQQQATTAPVEQQTAAVQQPTSTAPAQTAAAPIQQPNGSPVAPDTRRFDGTWIGTLTCNSTPSGLPGWSYELVGNVRNGVFHSQRGLEGKPGSETYDGTIEPGGSAEISQTGFSGDTKRDPFHRPTGTEYRNVYVGSFDGSHGKLTRLNRSSCTIDFTTLAVSTRSLGRSSPTGPR